MEIERLLEISKHVHTDKEVIGMILSNRITHYLGDSDGPAISIKNFELLADDILKWYESKAKAL
jgi:hypothetical protein